MAIDVELESVPDSRLMLHHDSISTNYCYSLEENKTAHKHQLIVRVGNNSSLNATNTGCVAEATFN